MIHLKNKKGAMEMSVGTIVTIVLLMSVLVLGIFLVQQVFDSGTGAVDAIDNEVQNQIQKLFQEEGKEIAVIPASGQIEIKQGESGGFALGISNKDTVAHTYEYTIEANTAYDYTGKCASGMTADKANSFLALPSGEIDVRAKGTFMPDEPIKFEIPESAPKCNIPFKLKLTNEDGPVGQKTIFVKIK